VVTGTVSNYGIEALAGYGLGSRLEIILTPLVFGIGSVLTASVGVNIGAKQFLRARKIAWTGAAISFLMVGIIGFTVTVFPEIWLNNFNANFLTKQFGILYLSIVAPFYCLFGAGQALYFASQGTGKIALPVSVGVLRFATVSITAYLALHFSLTIDIIFYAVSVGLTITGVGLALCLFGPDWKSSN
jgi:Na+-driven multidrug efflux pump